MDLKLIFEQISKVLNKLNKKQRIIILTTFVVIIAFLTYLVLFRVETKNEYENYDVLFSNLNPEDSAAILQRLQQDKIPYKIPQDNIILVPKDKVYEQRISLGSLGLPKTSKNVGFDILLENNVGETPFTQDMKYLVAKQNELARTIESLKPIEKAIVNISMPKESLFVQGGHPPSASVKITVQDNMFLSIEQVVGIKHLVAAAVERLTPQNVKIINQDGELLGEDDEATQQSALGKQAAFQRKYQQNAENAMEAKIVKFLKPSVGDGVEAQVTMDFDFSVRKSVAEVFGQNPVVRGTREYEKERKGFRPPQIGGVPGVVSNIGPVQGLKDDEMMEWEKESEVVINNEIDKTVSDIKEHFGVLKRVSASVMIDGTYKEAVGEDGEPRLEYIPRSQEEMDKFLEGVKKAIGYNEARGDQVEVINMQFRNSLLDYRPKDSWELFSDKVERYLGPFMPLLKYVIVAVIIFIFYKKIVAPFAERMLEVQEEEDDDIESLMQIDDGEDDVNKFSELRKRVEDQLGLSSGFDEDSIKYEVLLEKMRNVIAERPQEIGALFQTLIKDELDITEGIKH
ncbi:flagellar M-ring protein FliF [Helicobacter cinaedi]|uniref:Flagellar M-ring protein n=1 Tax=Helicobacter cinaedi CCUG 18818 = ATCC BAA-847 TaxID=537971 RepID=A0AAI8ML49_9HELI|nr:flagellar basal-body MS-ring/collar protein FliF [Helicobacter cinaedi]AWK61159.1 flagellar basal body M-ring protein FliF [Helicobacter cinaedi]EFR47308.1 flagellar M-ring protein FliF [Helicobacter cinaedi CCUG 18818 = ATCC BAA-847]QOQ90264.1 flagellar M-ring protein FliF [Helicobacter cinaedi]QOQ96436.1 flagellar M-ring protein FliF [Helicobacter cinaedi]BAM31578.1 flagellar MS-ring protein [Helicobacter cinaedi CCUG 18818 = ATCC BAA-847]